MPHARDTARIGRNYDVSKERKKWELVKTKRWTPSSPKSSRTTTRGGTLTRRTFTTGPSGKRGKVLTYLSEDPNPDREKIDAQAYCLALTFCHRIPHVRALVDTDIEATYDGDPAAYNKDEIVLSYPGLLATTINRLAHELFLLNVPLIPRIMTEYAHSRTGIDIHPGATIGEYFFIDHGTGVVVGSTTTIGNHVKVYQGVTLGALSTSEGHALHGHKRHPTIEDNVTIYSGASILGGQTVIGENCVIGSNAFITHSIPKNTRVTIKNQEQTYKTME